MEADSDGLNAPLQLEPFIHQVGGHSSMLQLDKNTICKPLIPQELNFYKTSPEQLRVFMPELKGVTEVTFNIDDDGFLNFTTYLPSGYSCKDPSEKCETKVKHRVRVCHSGSMQIESDSANGIKPTFEESHGHSSDSLLNPWVLHCHQKQVEKIQNSSSVFSQKYILLENLTSKYKFPCILDLKMGTRNYGDDASEAKRQSLMSKAVSTTSPILGIRVGGIQVYQSDSGHYICHNKYYGRSLTVDGFYHALYHFLYDGTELRQDVISELLKKLQKLKEVIQSLNTFRFFTSSLLVIYDGKRPSSANGSCVVCCSGACCHENNLVHLCKNGNQAGINKAKKNKNLLSDSSITNSSMPLPSWDECANAEIVDVRMIDFAHSTHCEMPGTSHMHEGPDEGYLFGLENLLAQLKTLHKK